MFNFTVNNAWLIENGKLKHPVEGATLIGSGPEVIKKIEMIGNDLKLDNGFGTCGKSGQLVPVGLGIPSCKVSMTVGGSKVKTGASGSNIAQSQADSGERAAPTAQKMGEFENTPGKAKGTSMKKEVKPATADGSEKSAKSPIAGK